MAYTVLYVVYFKQVIDSFQDVHVGGVSHLFWTTICNFIMFV